MVALYWRHSTVVADFLVPQDAFSCLRVRFDRALAVRAIDELAISSEERGCTGFAKDHCAYRVVDAHFWRSQSETFKFVHKQAQHYRFITANTCLDVISSAAPLIAVVPADAGPANIQPLVARDR